MVDSISGSVVGQFTLSVLILLYEFIKFVLDGCLIVGFVQLEIWSVFFSNAYFWGTFGFVGILFLLWMMLLNRDDFLDFLLSLSYATAKTILIVSLIFTTAALYYEWIIPILFHDLFQWWLGFIFLLFFQVYGPSDVA